MRSASGVHVRKLDEGQYFGGESYFALWTAFQMLNTLLLPVALITMTRPSIMSTDTLDELRNAFITTTSY